MKEYEIKNMIDKKTDDDSLRYFMQKFLIERGYYNVTNNNDINEMADIDIEADKNGEHYYFELKRRRCYTTTYPDAILSTHKYNTLKNANGKSFFIALYYDYIVVLDIDDDEQIIEFTTNKHTKTEDFERKYMVTEGCVKFKINKKIKYK